MRNTIPASSPSGACSSIADVQRSTSTPEKKVLRLGGRTGVWFLYPGERASDHPSPRVPHLSPRSTKAWQAKGRSRPLGRCLKRKQSLPTFLGSLAFPFPTQRRTVWRHGRGSDRLLFPIYCDKALLPCRGPLRQRLRCAPVGLKT